MYTVLGNLVYCVTLQDKKEKDTVGDKHAEEDDPFIECNSEEPFPCVPIAAKQRVTSFNKVLGRQMPLHNQCDGQRGKTKLEQTPIALPLRFDAHREPDDPKP